MYIGISGNIGSGKTTLTRMLSEHYGWTPRYESVTYNPYLEDYYNDITRWSFNLETYFLARRFRDLMEMEASKDIVVQDRTLFEGVNIFVANNRDLGNLSERDYDTYMQLYELLVARARYPDLLIYLRCAVPRLVERIRRRGREYEQGMNLEYLSGLNERYEKWVAEYPGRILVIDGDRYDFENRQEDFAAITALIDARIYGLFK
ncbi:MAG: deoxynucleoside kinase [Bacteroidales bacterium]|nr:deoxynucleoside kinase [Bacteroidales bacterium]